MSIAKKLVGASADKKVIRTLADRLQSRRLRATPRTAWAWPRATLAIVFLSLVLWGGVAAIALLAFD